MTVSRREFFKLFLESVRLPMALFVGAGISYPSGLPTFSQFSEHVLRAVIGDVSVPRKDFLGFTRQLRPEVLIQALMDHFGTQVLDFYNWFTGGVPNANHYFLAKVLQAGHCVFTTNVDQLIEGACHDLGVGYELCTSEKEYQAMLRRRSNQRGELNPCGCLFKLHGNIDTEQPDGRFETIQFSLNQVGQGISPGKRQVLERCLEKMDFAFLGYSGMDHFSVQPVLVGTSSQRRVFWLRFDPQASRQIQTSRSAFRRALDRELANALQPKSDGETLDWESLSVSEILAQRDQAVEWRGDTSAFVADILNEAGVEISAPKRRPSRPAPPWARRIPRWQRHFFVARLYYLMFNVGRAEHHARTALRDARKSESKADVYSLLGDIYLIPSSPDTDGQAIGAYQQAAHRYERVGEWHRSLLLRLDCANTYRRMREYGNALDEIDEVGRLIDNVPPGEKGYLESYKSSLEGLCIGLRGDVSDRDMRKAIRCCRAGAKHARQSGNVRRLAAALNSEGLVRFQANQLSEARACLEESLSLNTRVGDPRSCFQQCRNLGLVYLKQASLKAGSAKKRLLETALRTYESARSHLARVRPNPIGEVLEVEYRQGEVLIELGRKAEAQRILKKVAAEQKRLGNWHREVRALDVLMRATDDPGEQFSAVARIQRIYQQVLADDEKKTSLLDDKVRLANAKEIVEGAIKVARRLKQTGQLGEVDAVTVLKQIRVALAELA